MDPPADRRRVAHHVAIEMIEMDNEPGFVPAQQQPNPGAAIINRIAPRQPAGVLDGSQQQLLLVHPRFRSSRVPWYSSVSAWVRNMVHSEPIRDARRRSRCSPRCRVASFVGAILVTVSVIVVGLAILLSNPNPPRVNATVDTMNRPFHH